MVKEAIFDRGQSSTLWCGPYALAAVSGMTYEEARDDLAKARKHNSGGSQNVKGVFNYEMESAFDRHFGYPIIFRYIPFRYSATGKYDQPTLKQFLYLFDISQGTYILTFGNHYVTIENGKLLDNQNKQQTPFAMAKHMRKRVHEIARIDKVGWSLEVDKVKWDRYQQERKTIRLVL